MKYARTIGVASVRGRACQAYYRRCDFSISLLVVSDYRFARRSESDKAAALAMHLSGAAFTIMPMLSPKSLITASAI